MKQIELSAIAVGELREILSGDVAQLTACASALHTTEAERRLFRLQTTVLNDVLKQLEI